MSLPHLPKRELIDPPVSPETLSELWGKSEYLPMSPSRLSPIGDIEIHPYIDGHSYINHSAWKAGEEGGLNPDETVELAKEHFGRLSDFGMVVLGHTMEVRTDLSESEQNDPATPQVLYATRHFPKGSHWKLATGRVEEAGRENVIEAIVNPLQVYFEWCIDTGQTHYLAAIAGRFGLHSYAKQASPTELSGTPSEEGTPFENGEIYLLNVSPDFVFAEGDPGSSRQELERLLESPVSIH